MTDVTRILNAIEKGDAQATEKLLPLVYEELHTCPALEFPWTHSHVNFSQNLEM